MKEKRFLNAFFLGMLNLSVMASLRQLPLIAEYGYGSIFLFCLVALLFLFPCALVSAELATGWGHASGIYIWVREAFGPKWGFFAIWMQWIHNVTWYPAILSFSATTLAYFFSPTLAENRFYLISFILIGFWSMTFFNYWGLKLSSWFSAVGVIAGTLIPGVLIAILGVLWVLQGNPVEIPFSPDSLIPPLTDIQNLVFLVGLFLAFGGLEVSAVHVREVQDPKKTFPRAILLAAVSAFAIYVAGALTIAIVIPKEEISLIAGVIETFRLFFEKYHINYLLLPLALLIVFGAIGEVNAWIIGPVRGLHLTSEHGDLPPIFQKLNKRGIPANLLAFQGIIATGVSFVFLFMPSASSALWILSALSAQLYLIMYVFMFLSAIKLRYSHPEIPRAYKIPFHLPGIWIVAGMGAISSFLAFLIGFVPPSQIQVGSLLFYESFLLCGTGIMCAIPLWIYRFRKESWKTFEP